MPSFRPNPTSLAATLRQKFLTNPDPKFCDTVLCTTDEKTLPVCRPLLAARIPYFEDLLYSGGTPKQEPRLYPENLRYIFVPTKLALLRIIVEFAYTHDCTFIRSIRRRRRAVSSSTDRYTAAEFKEQVVNLVSLMSISRYMQILPLEIWARKTLKHLTRRNPLPVCTVLRELHTLPAPTQIHYMPLIRLFIKRVADNPIKTLAFPDVDIAKDSLQDQTNSVPTWGITEFGNETISALLNANVLKPEVAFRAIYFWATGGKPIQKNSGVVVIKDESEMRRWAHAKLLLKHVNIEQLSGQFLVSFVGPSGLLPDQQLLKLMHRELAGIYDKEGTANEKNEDNKGNCQGGVETAGNAAGPLQVRKTSAPFVGLATTQKEPQGSYLGSTVPGTFPGKRKRDGDAETNSPAVKRLHMAPNGDSHHYQHENTPGRPEQRFPDDESDVPYHHIPNAHVNGHNSTRRGGRGGRGGRSWGGGRGGGRGGRGGRGWRGERAGRGRRPSSAKSTPKAKIEESIIDIENEN